MRMRRRRNMIRGAEEGGDEMSWEDVQRVDYVWSSFLLER
jgi:hypothetical protein